MGPLMERHDLEQWVYHKQKNILLLYMRSERCQFFFNLVFSFVSSDYKLLKGAPMRYLYNQLQWMP